MSTRAIAPVVGVSYQQAAKDRQVSHEATPAPERRTATFQSGGGFIDPGAKVEPDTETAVDLDTGNVISERSITGVGGKTCRAPTRAASATAGHDLRGAATGGPHLLPIFYRHMNPSPDQRG